jgi:GNAT superfamily N-acetyltransferase
MPMRSRRLRMSYEAFERLSRPPGWKYEYVDGYAYIRPSHHVVVTTVAVRPRPVETPCALREIATEDEARLLSVYLEAFADNQAFCDYTEAQYIEAARADLLEGFRGRRAPLLAASRVAVDSDGESLVGAALLSRDQTYGPVMDLLFIGPAWQRCGLATALVASAMNALHEEGDPALTSSYQLANMPSQLWHRAFGFVERPDLHYAQAYYRWALHELDRRTETDDLSASELAELEAQVAYWRHGVESLERMAEEHGYHTVAPRFPHR